MVTTRESDWSAQLNATPWIQKLRPGLRHAAHGRPMHFVAAAPDTQPHTAVSTDSIATASAMPANTRKQRLLDEAHECEADDVSSVESAFVLLVIIVLALAMYWGTAAIVLGSATNQRLATAQHDSTMPKKAQAISSAAREASERHRAATSKDGSTP